MLLRVNCLLYLTTERLEDGLEICIDYEGSHTKELVIVELQLRLLGAGRLKHVKHRHEVVVGAELLVTRENFIR